MTALEAEKIDDIFVKVRRDDLQKILELVKNLQTRLEPARQSPLSLLSSSLTVWSSIEILLCSFGSRGLAHLGQ